MSVSKITFYKMMISTMLRVFHNIKYSIDIFRHPVFNRQRKITTNPYFLLDYAAACFAALSLVTS